MNAPLGLRVRSRHDFVDAPQGTEGIIVEDYGTGFTVAWDLPNKRLPKLPPEEIALMYAVHPMCPLRDGFDKDSEADMLDYWVVDEWVQGPLEEVTA